MRIIEKKLIKRKFLKSKMIYLIYPTLTKLIITLFLRWLSYIILIKIFIINIY